MNINHRVINLGSNIIGYVNAIKCYQNIYSEKGSCDYLIFLIL